MDILNTISFRIRHKHNISKNLKIYLKIKQHYYESEKKIKKQSLNLKNHRRIGQGCGGSIATIANFF